MAIELRMHARRRSKTSWAAIMLGLALPGLMSGCASAPITDPITEAQNPKRSPVQRLEALRQAWADVDAGRIQAAAVRPETKDIAWSPASAPGLRMEAFELLMRNPSAEELEDTRRMIKLRLPRETNPAVVAYLCGVVAEREWTDASPAVVRAWSQPMGALSDEKRPERRALESLHPGRDARDVVMGVFLDPREPGDEVADQAAAAKSPTEANSRTERADEIADRHRRVRADAWTVLDRLDPDGTFRLRAIEDPTVTPSESSKATWVALKAGWSDLHALPRTGDEVAWLVQLHDDASEQGRAWWSAARAAAALVKTKQAREHPHGFDLRHLEPMRLRNASNSSWADRTSDDLKAEIAAAIADRETYRRDKRDGSDFTSEPIDDRFQTWRSGLSWADAMTIQVIDEALQAPETAEELFRQVALDREDRGTEYGGALAAITSSATGISPQTERGETRFKWTMYVPRAGARESDEKFIAPMDMLNQTARSLAHYHFHVQRPRNSEYAGPSGGDLDYAKRHGRTCLVFTSIGEDVLNADIYFPNGAVIDLGEIRRPANSNTGGRP